jgi:hypothetical protein
MARSSGFSVAVMLPCVNCCAMVVSCVPMPDVVPPAPLSAAA